MFESDEWEYIDKIIYDIQWMGMVTNREAQVTIAIWASELDIDELDAGKRIRNRLDQGLPVRMFNDTGH